MSIAFYVHVGTWCETLFSQALYREISCFRLVLVKACHEVFCKGNGCSQSRMGAFDFSNFESSIFFVGRNLQKAQCMFV